MKKEKNTYKIIIVDDHPVFRNGLKTLLNQFDNVELIAEASNGKEFLQINESHQADLVFMDINMPVLDGIDTTVKALQSAPEIKIIALTAFGDYSNIQKMLDTGVDGYMLKNSEIDEYHKAIQSVLSGGNYFSAKIIADISQHIPFKQQKSGETISKREKQVLQLICQGFSNHEISEKLFISERTVERHKTNLMRKTDTKNTVNLVIYAFKHSLTEM